MKKILFLLSAIIVVAYSCKKTEPPIIAIPIDPNDSIAQAPPFLYAGGGRVLAGPVGDVPCDPYKVCLIYPENNSVEVDRTPLFIWKKFDNIEQYQIQVSQLEFFPTSPDSMIYYHTNRIVNDTQYFSDWFYHGGGYYPMHNHYDYIWRVRGIRGIGDTTIWSETYTFRTLNVLDSLVGDYDVAEISWDYNYPWPYEEDSTGHFYTARVSKLSEVRLLVEILGKGLSWEMIQLNDLSYKEDVQSWHYAYAGFYLGAVGPGFIPGSEIEIRDANRGNNPGYHWGGEYYRGYRH